MGLSAVLLLTGCTDPQSAPNTQPSTSSPSTPTASSSPVESEAPALVPEGSAADNLPIFTTVVAGVWATPEQVSGRAYIDALVGVGFDKAAMQVTFDQSTVGNLAESIQFSVRWGQECLVGQVGPATGAPVTVVVPVLAEGTCLVGGTRPIDW
jgi:hypothetical protein